MSKMNSFIVIASLAGLGTAAAGQERGFSARTENVSRDFTTVAAAAPASDVALTEPFTGMLSCPFEALEAAYREATTGFEIGAQYVTTLEVLSLCADHDRLFKAALDAEKQLIESYNAMMLEREPSRNSGTSSQTATDAAARTVTSDGAPISASPDMSFVSQVAQCLPEQTVGLSLDAVLDVSVPLAADGKIAGDLVLLNGQESEADAPRVEFEAVERAILACGTVGYQTEGLDLSRPLEVSFTLNELYELKSAAQLAAGVDANGCPVPRPAAGYVLTGSAAAAGRAPFVDLAVDASFDDTSGWFTDTYFVKLNDELPGGVKVVEINVTDYDNPDAIKHVILRDCAGEMRSDMTTRVPRISTETLGSIITYRNLRTGETTSAPEPTVFPSLIE